MAKNTSKFSGLSGFLCLILGILIGFSAITYFKLPQTEDVIVSEENVFYSKDSHELTSTIPVNEANISVHFLELGNKYTGDCTYIKTDTCDILIDCGSKSNSIPYISNYLNQYVTDGKLEYVIITHAHQDHYAGFATNENVDSIFDLYTCENIITFSQTNQSESSKLYKNFKRELNEELNSTHHENINTEPNHHFTALECINEQNNAQRIFDIGTNITLEILDSYYYNHTASTENDYSVCTLITYQQDETNQINMLFTGDLEEDGEEYLVDNNSLPQVDLYKAGHHGSKTSSTKKLLQAIEPKTICVCCCAGSPEYTSNVNNQFPTQQFISNIFECCPNAKIYVTTLCLDYKNDKFTSFNGNIIFMCTFEGYVVECSNNKINLIDSEWFVKNRKWCSWEDFLNLS